MRTVIDLFNRITKHHVDTARHLNSVRDLTYILAKRLNYGDGHAEAIARAAYLHDIGKLYIPISILDAPRRLEPDEMRIIHAHPLTGAQLAHGLGESDSITQWIANHHERLDGNGYPFGRTDPPVEALIIAATDIWDATGAIRPYPLFGTPPQRTNDTRYTSRADRLAIIREETHRIGHDIIETFIELLGEPGVIADRQIDTSHTSVA